MEQWSTGHSGGPKRRGVRDAPHPGPRHHPTARPARTARGPFPARTLHLVDIENLAGTGLPAESQVAGLSRAYAAHLGLGPMDQVVIACNHNALPAAAHGWPGARYLVRSGPDGADTELLAVLADENIAARFTAVTIASCDHAFTWAAARLAAAGCQVTVASRPEALSRQLALAAHHVIRFQPSEAAPAAGRPDAA